MKKLIQIWKFKNQILKGLKNKLFKTSDVEVMYEKRLKVCKECTLYDILGTNCYVVGTQPCCSECGCSLGIKLRSPDSECGHPEGAKWI